MYHDSRHASIVDVHGKMSRCRPSYPPAISTYLWFPQLYLSETVRRAYDWCCPGLTWEYGASFFGTKKHCWSGLPSRGCGAVMILVCRTRNLAFPVLTWAKWPLCRCPGFVMEFANSFRCLAMILARKPSAGKMGVVLVIMMVDD